MTQRHVETPDGVRLSVRVDGRLGGPTLLLCDGIGCDGYIWKYVREALAGHCQLVHFNYRAHGEIEVPADLATLTIRQFASDCWTVLDALEIERAVLCGHSMGVQVILEAANQRRSRTIALVPSCGAFERPLDTFRGSGMASQVLPLISSAVFARPDTLRRLWRDILPTEFAWWLATVTEVNAKMIRREDFAPYLEHLSLMDPLIFVRLLENLAQHSARSYLDGLDMPALVFAGSRDRFTPSSLAEELADALPDAELCLIPGGSHTALIELPDLVVLRLEVFLRDIGVL